METIIPALAATGYCLHLVAAFIEYDMRFSARAIVSAELHNRDRSRLALRCIIVGCLCGSSAYLGELAHRLIG